MKFSITQGIIILVAGLVFLAFVLVDKQAKVSPVPDALPHVEVQEPENDGVIDTSDWIEYRNKKFGFTFKYPEVFFNSFESEDEGIFLLGDIPGVERMEVFYYEPLEGDITQTQEIDKIIAWKGELRRSHLIRETENPKLYHFYKERGGFIDEDIIIVDDRTGNIVMFAIERTTDASLPVDQILSTFEFITPTATTGTASLPILPPGGSGAATNLEAVTSCSETELRRGIALLEWKVADEPGTEQRVELTIFLDGFEQDGFEVSPFLSPDQSRFEWEELSGQANHFWRVSTRHPDGWIPSESSIFTGPTCVADSIGISG